MSRKPPAVPMLERDEVQREHARLEKETSPISTFERQGELVLAFGDSDRHERRIQRAISSAQDRLFWGTLAVACGAPGELRGSETPKEFGHLKLARHDLDAFYEYYRPMQKIGNPWIVGVVPGLDKSPRYFDRAYRLDNPSVDQLRSAVLSLREWVVINQNDPEYTSFQLNFTFSGHGVVSPLGEGSLMLADRELAGDEA